MPNAALAKVGNLDIVKLEFVAQQLQHTVDKLSYRLPFSPNDKRKVKVCPIHFENYKLCSQFVCLMMLRSYIVSIINFIFCRHWFFNKMIVLIINTIGVCVLPCFKVAHVQPKKERIGSDAEVLGIIHEHHSSTSSRGSVFESAAWSEHIDSVINSVACGNASRIQCAEVSTGTGSSSGDTTMGTSSSNGDTTTLKIEKAEEVLKGTALKMKGRKSNNSAKLILNRQTGETALHKAARLGREVGLVVT